MTRNVGLNMADSWSQGRFNPLETGQYYSQMMGTPDQSAGYYGQMANMFGSTQVGMPDYSAWMNPESMRSSWFLQDPTMGQNIMPTAQGGTQQMQGGGGYGSPLDNRQFSMPSMFGNY